MDGMIRRNLGKYQIVEPLGEGGMATVYKAYDPTLERYVAVKVIRAVSRPVAPTSSSCRAIRNQKIDLYIPSFHLL